MLRLLLSIAVACSLLIESAPAQILPPGFGRAYIARGMMGRPVSRAKVGRIPIIRRTATPRSRTYRSAQYLRAKVKEGRALQTLQRMEAKNTAAIKRMPGMGSKDAHFLKDHGAQTRMSQHVRRIDKGIAPGGQLRKANTSTKFYSHRKQLLAIRLAQRKLKRDKPIRFDDKGRPRWEAVTIHGRGFGHGYTKVHGRILPTKSLNSAEVRFVYSPERGSWIVRTAFVK